MISALVVEETLLGSKGEPVLAKKKEKRNIHSNRENSRADILRSGRLGSYSPLAARYTSSIEPDKKLFGAVLAINSAHLLMLAKKNLVKTGDAAAVLKILANLQEKDLAQADELEDVHMNVENYVISKTGKEIGGILNLGKSRNDQVATALRLTLRKEILVLGEKLVEFAKQLLRLSEMHYASIMPGYTHLQRAQPVTLGHHLLAHVETLDRDLRRILGLYPRINSSPMGAAALASTDLPIEREMVRDLLGFDSLLENSLDAVSSRDFLTEAIYVASQIMIDLSRISEEVILWSTKEFDFIIVSPGFASTSSIMPQKKNAVVSEVARARASHVLSDLVAGLSIVKSLPLSYNIDLQELSRNLWSAIDNAMLTLDVYTKMFAEIKFDKEKMLKAATSDDYMYSTEIANFLVLKYGLSFREAHGRVATLVRFCEDTLEIEDSPFRAIGEQDLKSILGVPISKAEIETLLDPSKILSRRKSVGSPNPLLVKESCAKKSREILRILSELKKLERKNTGSKSKLDSAVLKMIAQKNRR